MNEGRTPRSRREQFVNPPPRKGGLPLAPLITLGLIVLLAVVYRAGFSEEGAPPAAVAPLAHSTAEAPPLARSSAPVAAAARPDVVMPAAQFDDGTARFFTYEASQGETVRFFVMKSADGVIRAAFDACDVCYREKRGYRQQGDRMLCVNCGQTFRSNDINERQGGCNPAPLDRAIVEGQVVLKAADLERGAFYF